MYPPIARKVHLQAVHRRVCTLQVFDVVGRRHGEKAAVDPKVRPLVESAANSWQPVATGTADLLVIRFEILRATIMYDVPHLRVRKI